MKYRRIFGLIAIISAASVASWFYTRTPPKEVHEFWIVEIPLHIETVVLYTDGTYKQNTLGDLVPTQEETRTADGDGIWRDLPTQILLIPHNRTEKISVYAKVQFDGCVFLRDSIRTEELDPAVFPSKIQPLDLEKDKSGCRAKVTDFDREHQTKELLDFAP